jgi:hypothetical protein
MGSIEREEKDGFLYGKGAWERIFGWQMEAEICPSFSWI